MTTVSDDRFAELAARASGPPPESWRPDLPEKLHPNPIVGTLRQVRHGRDHPEYGPIQVAEIEDPQGMTWAVWLVGMILSRDLSQEIDGTPRPGDAVAIHYDGKKPKPNGGHYNVYRVVFDRAGDPPARVQAAAVEERPVQAPVAPATAPVPDADAAATCPACGFLNGFHRDGCPAAPKADDDIPF
jgi:hypothetical protein